MKWLNNITWQKLVLLLVVILIVTKITVPDVADWILTPIMTVVDIGRDFFGDIQ